MPVYWPAFPIFIWTFYSLCPIVLVLSNARSFSSVLGFVSSLLRGTDCSSTIIAPY